MKLYYFEDDLTSEQHDKINNYCNVWGCHFFVMMLRKKGCWCCFIDNQFDDLVLGCYLGDLGFKTLNIDAVLDDLDRLINNYKSKEDDKDEN